MSRSSQIGRWAPDVVSKVDDLSLLPSVTVDRKVSVTGYHPSSTVGGGEFVGVAAARHDGGKYIDPSRPFPTDWNDDGQVSAWFLDSGADAACFARVDSAVSIQGYGASTLYDCYRPVKKCIENNSVIASEGKYDLFTTNGWIVPSNKIIDLSGSKVTSQDYFDTFLVNESINVTIKNAVFDTTVDPSTFPTPIPTPTGIRCSAPGAAGAKATRNVKIFNCEFYNLRIGISLFNPDVDAIYRVGDVMIDNIYGENLYAALAQLDGQDITLSNARLRGGSFDCIDVHQGKNVNINNVICNGISEYGLLIRTFDNGKTENVNVNNYIILDGLGVFVNTLGTTTAANVVDGVYIKNLQCENTKVWVQQLGAGAVRNVDIQGYIKNSVSTGRVVYCNNANFVKLDIDVRNPDNVPFEITGGSQVDLTGSVSGAVGKTFDLVKITNAGGFNPQHVSVHNMSLQGGQTAIVIDSGARHDIRGNEILNQSVDGVSTANASFAGITDNSFSNIAGNAIELVSGSSYRVNGNGFDNITGSELVPNASTYTAKGNFPVAVDTP